MFFIVTLVQYLDQLIIVSGQTQIGSGRYHFPEYFLALNVVFLK